MSPDGEGPAPAEPGRYCTNCGTKLGPASNFCQNCGMPVGGQPAPVPPPYQPYLTYPAPKSISARDLGMGIGAYGVLALLFLMVVNVVILLWGIGLVYPHMDHQATLFIITPFLVPIAELGGSLFFLYYVFLALAITASFIWMLRMSLPTYTKELRVKYPEKGHSPLYIIGTLFMAVMAFNFIFYLFVQSSGISPTTPDFTTVDLWQLLYSYAEASVWEEIVSRILLIGVPLLIIDALLMARDPARKMRQTRRYFLGGGFDIGRKEAFFMVFSAIMFGTAHVFSWDVFKILPAAVAGLAFGYLFLKLGVYASILLHFGFDYLSIPLDVAPDNLTLTVVLGLLILAWVVIGAAYVAMYAAKGLGWLTGRRVWPDVPRVSPQQAAASHPAYYYQPYYYQQPPNYAPGPAPVPQPAPATWNARPAPPPRPSNPTAIGYVCQHCGNTEATYKDGQLVCTKCGSKN